MQKEQNSVALWMAKAEQVTPSKPVIPTDKVCHLRMKLIDEEVFELERALFEQDLTEIADSLGDILYVVLGTAVACGIQIEPIFHEIHKSNMSKFIDGKKNEDGKLIKGPKYTPPNLLPIIKEQQK